ncbi:sugar transferase [Janthinobacterium sp. 17J80-10]|uniref:sugar transferase n=1 Tax=Janthinobacterium sp. 17J80-10 TaxID=2497863 RepID=UPI0010053145|nr:sugar transferase [Janthinobacterium sp. 17J80-10]QAU33070.1 sugar transferase [Janthinobacterium sp. 17J80-10]
MPNNGQVKRFEFYRGRVKGALDRLAGALFLLVFSPLMILIALLILLFNGRPIFFMQTRVGRGGHAFSIYKFRTMTVESGRNSSRSGEVAGQSLEEARKRFKTTDPNDRRITAVGKILRKTHLDELPQFINVVNGDMALVGPRPDVPVQEADYRPRYWRVRCMVKPGITGLAQVISARSTRHRLAMDIWYVRNLTFALDLKILLRTVMSVIRAKSF